MNKLTRLLIVASFCCLYSLDSLAFVVYELHEDGSSSEISTAWSVYDTAPVGGTEIIDQSGGTGTNWSIKLGDFDFSDQDDLQDSGLYGAYTSLAPAYGYEVRFRFDGYSWDAYNGGPTDEDFDEFGGYFDVFAVNINQEDTYENLVFDGFGFIEDPIIPIDPAGEVVVSENTSDDPDSLPGKTWAWGGHDYTPDLYEEEHGFYSLNLFGDANKEYILNFVLDTTGDDYIPSYGCFSFWNNCGVIPPLFGDTQDPLADANDTFGIPEPAPLLLIATALMIMLSVRKSMPS